MKRNKSSEEKLQRKVFQLFNLIFFLVLNDEKLVDYKKQFPAVNTVKQNFTELEYNLIYVIRDDP